MSSKVFQLAEKTSWKEMDGLVIIVDTVSGAYYSLNQVASDIWINIVSGKAIEEVRKELLDKYSVDKETLSTDISACVDKWLKEGLII